MAERKMIIVLVYIDGRIQHGDKGVEYNIPPKITFPALEATTFEEVRNENFQALGYTEDHCAISIQARFDIGNPGPQYFQLISIYEDKGWKMIFEKTCGQVVELYVNCTSTEARLSQVNSMPLVESSRHSERDGSGVSLEPGTIHSAGHVVSTLAHDPHSTALPLSPPTNQGNMEYETTTTIGDANIAEDTYVGEETDLAEDGQDSGNEQDSDDALNNSSDDDISEPRVTHSVNAFPLMRASGQYAIKAFSDLSVLRETTADESFFGCKNQFDNPLAEAKTFDSKEHLQIAIGKYKGRLLIACGYDANNQLLPLAFAIVEKEDSTNWGWFMRWLRKEQPHIGWYEGAGECVHRLCSQHVAENLWKACRNDMVLKTFKWVVKKKKPRKFEEGMLSIANICPEAITYLEKVGKYLEEDKDEQEKPKKEFWLKFWPSVRRGGACRREKWEEEGGSSPASTAAGAKDEGSGDDRRCGGADGRRRHPSREQRGVRGREGDHGGFKRRPKMETMASSPANVGNRAPASFGGNQAATEVRADSVSVTAAISQRSGGSSGGDARPEVGGGRRSSGARRERGRRHGRVRREWKEGEEARGSDL
uniref:MULE transposase domain-containing protein n=1 Tax=Oryza meridionalis TaxID=40149 RepID=A0A0E0FDH7_9ORYZ